MDIESILRKDEIRVIKTMHVLVSIGAFTATGPVIAKTEPQCAGCGAEANKADREKADREGRERADRTRADNVREHMGNGTLRDTADKAKDHNDRNDRAFKDAQ